MKLTEQSLFTHVSALSRCSRVFRSVRVKWVITVAALITPMIAQAFTDLTAAQSLVYTEHHLRNTTEGQLLSYEYRSTSPDEDNVEDKVTLTVSKVLDDDRRNISLNFLTDERRMILPDFDGYVGNPIVIAMLEHTAQRAGAETEGGALYFRNRIRDGLALESLVIEKGSREFGGKMIATKEIVFMPFLKDKFLGGNVRYEQMRYRLVFSDEAPAGVLEISASASAPNGDVIASRSLTLMPTNP